MNEYTPKSRLKTLEETGRKQRKNVVPLSMRKQRLRANIRRHKSPRLRIAVTTVTPAAHPRRLGN